MLSLARNIQAQARTSDDGLQISLRNVERGKVSVAFSENRATILAN